MTNIVGDTAANYIKTTATQENANWAWQKAKENSAWGYEKAKQHLTWENAKAGAEGTKKFVGKVDNQLDQMGVDKKEVAKKTGTAMWEAGSALASAMWTGSKAVYGAATTKDGEQAQKKA